MCGRECNSYSSLSRHLGVSHGISGSGLEDYYIKYIKSENDGVCKQCGKPTKFIRISTGYRPYCCKQCYYEYVNGKTWDELLTHDGLIRMKNKKPPSYTQERLKKMSEHFKKNNPMYNHEFKEKARLAITKNHPMRGKTYEELYGKEKSDSLKKVRLKNYIETSKNLTGIHSEEARSNAKSNINREKVGRLCAYDNVDGKTCYYCGGVANYITSKGKFLCNEYIMKCPAIREKNRLRMIKNNPIRDIDLRNRIFPNIYKGPTKPQIKLYDIVSSMFPDAVLEYEFFQYIMDIAILDINLCIEYDSSYWHSKCIEKDYRRNEFMNNKGWRVLRYIDHIPEKKSNILFDINNMFNNNVMVSEIRKVVMLNAEPK
jgi:hypothetical protein